MSNGKILVTGTSVRENLLKPVVDRGYDVKFVRKLLSEDELSHELSDCVGYLFGDEEVATSKVLAGARKLRMIAFLGVGYENYIDIEVAKSRGIRVTNTPGTLMNSVSEFTVALLLNALRRLSYYAEMYRAGNGGKEEKERDLAARTVGVIGLGEIGIRISEILRKGFGSSVSYYSRTRKPEVEKRLGINYLDLNDLVSSVDCLIVMAPGNPSTKDLITKEMILARKSPMVLINTARPGVVSAEGLLAGLQTGQISVAGYDGFYDGPEPLTLGASKTIVPELLKFGSDRLVITAHIASLTHEARDNMTRKCVASLVAGLEGADDPDVVA